jgi:hypothetical protein
MKTIRNLASIFLSLSIFLSGCEVHIGTPETPSHPSSIPASATWVGGSDGGVFVLLSAVTPEAKGTVYEVKVFEPSGNLAYEGKLKLNSKSESPIESNLFDAWDGDTLYLKDGRSLSVPE